MPESSGTVRRTEIERIIQVGLGAVLTLVLGLGVNTLTETSRAVATQGVKIDALTEQIADLKAGSKAAYPATEAAREFVRIDVRIADLEQRVRALEMRPAPASGGPR